MRRGRWVWVEPSRAYRLGYWLGGAVARLLGRRRPEKGEQVSATNRSNK